MVDNTPHCQPSISPALQSEIERLLMGAENPSAALQALMSELRSLWLALERWDVEMSIGSGSASDSSMTAVEAGEGVVPVVELSTLNSQDCEPLNGERQGDEGKVIAFFS